MSRHLGASILLASTDPDRLRSFDSTAFDGRDDVAERTSEDPDGNLTQVLQMSTAYRDAHS